MGNHLPPSTHLPKLLLLTFPGLEEEEGDGMEKAVKNRDKWWARVCLPLILFQARVWGAGTPPGKEEQDLPQMPEAHGPTLWAIIVIY